jgi:nitric oxide reductase NorD protein
MSHGCARRAHTARLLAALPGLRPLHQTLSAALRAGRPRRPLPREEAAVEAAVLAALGDAEAAARDPQAAAMLDPSVPLERFRTGRRYRAFLPVPLWGERTASEPAQERREAGEAEGAAPAAPPDARRRRARRRQNDQTRRRDPLLLNRFENNFGLAEMVNLNRAVEDDDEEGARKAADDLDEIAVGAHKRRAATRLKMELDLPGEAVATEPLRPETLTYPEWDHTRRTYLRDHCRVIAEPADRPQQGEDWRPDEAARRRIRRVRRQFEALRPRRRILHAQPDGEELDLSALVRALADRRAGAPGSERVYSAARTDQRDLAVDELSM